MSTIKASKHQIGFDPAPANNIVLTASNGDLLVNRGVHDGTLTEIARFSTNGLPGSNVGYTPAGTGAVTTTVQAKLTEYVNIANYIGFVGNGTNDDKAAVEAAAAYCVSSGKGLYCPPGYSVKLSGSVNLKNIRNISIESDIVISTGTLTVGGNVNGGKFTIYLQSVTNGTNPVSVAPPTNPVVQCTGLANSEITIGSCNYIQLYADASVANERFVAYNQFKLTGAVALLELTDSGTALSYVNENFIYADRIVRYKIAGVGYQHNHNKLFHPCMEGASTQLTFTGGVHVNQVYGARFENVGSSPGITFSSDSFSNTITSSWSGDGNPRFQFALEIPVNDAGEGNLVTTESAINFNQTTLFNVGQYSQILSTATDTVAPDVRIAPANAGVSNLNTKAILVPSLKGFYVTSSFRWIALTDPIPVSLGDVVTFDGDFDGNLVRTFIYVLDADMKPLLSNSGGEFVSQAGTTFDSVYGGYSQGSNQSAGNLKIKPASIIRSDVKFIRVGVALGTAGFIRNINAKIFTQSLYRGFTEGSKNFTALRSLNGTPTQGYAPLNTLIWDYTSGLMRRCTFQYETVLNGALLSGATSVTVSAISTISNGDICGILLDNGETHWSAISGLSGSTFTITAIPAGRSAPNGGRIVFNRWA